MREVESVKEAGSRGAGIRVLVGQRTGSSYTSDLSPDGIASWYEAALALAKITSEDPHAGLPEREDLGQLKGDLRMYDPSIEQMETARKIEMAKRAEIAALDFDPRIQNSEGLRILHVGSRACLRTREDLPAATGPPVADYRVSPSLSRTAPWSGITGTRRIALFAKLESPEKSAAAAERAIRRLNPRKVADTESSRSFRAKNGARAARRHLRRR